MALKIPVPFPIFPPPIQSPNNPNQTRHRPPSELRFSRWNNANAEKFNERRRTLKEIEDDLRIDRRFGSANRIAKYYDSATVSPAETFKSAGTPSHPSKPSIPGKKSKYSKNPNPDPDSQHPAFRPFHRSGENAATGVIRKPRPRPLISRDANVKIGEDGVSYVIEGAPFEFKYSYTETPKVKPVGLREEAYTPFGPTTMARPWTGRAPLPASKKAPREFDSFKLPPPHKKGVKPVQSPGPYLAGSGPKYVRTREEILGEPLTKEERLEMIESCKKTQRQLNMGRDGLTHNMLDNIHAHWKRRRVCKIKCKGVCTVDMETVRQQLEERTGGRIIYSTGGVIYLYRGRNYNYKTRPRFPLMLWKPITPVYPRLVQRVPEGMSLEEVTDMRKKGHKLIPMCKLGKNGVYCYLAEDVREAFEECELVRINCEGMNSSDYHKIGAKLKDLVPCVLISFAHEHILMWRGRDWKPSLPKLDMNFEESKDSKVENAPSSLGKEATTPQTTFSIENSGLSKALLKSDGAEGSSESLSSDSAEPIPSATEVSNPYKTEISSDETGSDTDLRTIEICEIRLDSVKGQLVPDDTQQTTSEEFQDVSEPESINTACTEGVLLLLNQALMSGGAIILNEEDLDADAVYKKTAEFSKSAPPGPVFVHQVRKVEVPVKKSKVQEDDEEQDIEDLDPQVVTTLRTKSGSEKKGSKPKTRRRKPDFGELLLDHVVPQGSLRVDELAKLLA